jgi:hypothetical protein
MDNRVYVIAMGGAYFVATKKIMEMFGVTKVIEGENVASPGLLTDFGSYVGSQYIYDLTTPYIMEVIDTSVNPSLADVVDRAIDLIGMPVMINIIRMFIDGKKIKMKNLLNDLVAVQVSDYIQDILGTMMPMMEEPGVNQEAWTHNVPQ